jgi:hypothetical protein
VADGLDLAGMQRVAAAIDPGARLVTPRTYRRLTGLRRRGRGIPRGVPIRRLETAESGGFGPDATGSIDAGVHEAWLVPFDSTWTRDGDGSALRRLWFVLLARAVERSILAAGLSEAELGARIESIGEAAYREAIAVLREDGLIGSRESAMEVYAAFTGRFLALRRVEPASLGATFPAISEPARVEEMLRRDLDLERLVNATRPPEAAPGRDAEPIDAEPEEIAPESGVREPASAEEPQSLARRAERATARGNDVRAAILWARAAHRARPERGERYRRRSRAAIQSLAARLSRTLGDGSSAAEWRRALEPLREPAKLGIRSRAARVLFSLQMACVDRERPTGRLDLMGWLLSAGRAPLRRATPDEWLVRRMRHLRQASSRLGRAAIADVDRARLANRLSASINRAEDDLRRVFRPQIEASLREAGMEPSGMVERVGERKLIEELLDRAAGQGFVTAGELRDAIARNAVKLPDLEAGELWRGDRYLRADRALATHLDGVYRRAEVYLRGLQKTSSVAFGTSVGRWLTLNLALPFGGAFVVLEGLQHLVEPVLKAAAWVTGRRAESLTETATRAVTLGLLNVEPIGERVREARHEALGPRVHLMTAANVLILGIFLLVLVRSERFRRGLLRGLIEVGRGVRAVGVDLPRWVAARPWVVMLAENRWVRRAWRWMVGPGLAGGLFGWALRAAGAEEVSAWSIGAGAYFAVLGLTVTRAGRMVRDEVADLASRAWLWVGHDFLPGLVRSTLRFFRVALERLDRVLFAVDEFFRFRGDEARWAIGLKAVAGAIWAGVRYVVRMVVNLLVEPQVNPIKHFPVVTVAHKVTLPFILALPPVFMGALGMGRDVAYGLAFFLQLLLPGVFGFLVWELKENWKLYEANRPRTLRPTIVGSHGETMPRLLRPGFHSGTVPRAFRAMRAGRPGSYRPHETLHHVEHDVERFVERELLALVAASRSLGGVPLRVGHVGLATRRIVAEVEPVDRLGDRLAIAFEEQDGRLVAGIEGECPAWLEELRAEARTTLANGLAGLYARAGVEIVAEQARRALGGEFSVENGCLLAWRNGTGRVEIGLEDVQAAGGRTLADRAMFARRPILWSQWVEAWEREAEGRAVSLGSQADVLPDADGSGVARGAGRA